MEHYRKAVRLNPNAIDARESLASGLLNQGEMAEAEQHFRALLTLAPECNETRAKLGTILAVGGRLHEAAKILTEAVKFDPNDTGNLLKLGQVMAAQGKLSEAVLYFPRLRGFGRRMQSHTKASVVHYWKLAKKEEASKHLEQALRILRATPSER